MSKAKCIMVQGTMSGAGKSLLCAALCRIFAQDGYRVAPFKSQNMALNSFVTRNGAEMGRAQVVQAQAAGVEPDVRMNPILLKPSSDVGSQVIVNGKARGQMPAAAYFKMKRSLIPDILEAYNSLAAENDIIVIEGAGSPAEINLKADDIVNMGLAKLVDAPVLLAGDIDRGGVFAQLYGTVELLEADERARIRGLIINKFRGDVEILRPGLAMLEEKTQLPVLGATVMFYQNTADSVALTDLPSYVAKTDSAGMFRVTNIKDDTYRVMAIDDARGNYLFVPSETKVGFIDSLIQTISFPTTVYDTIHPDTTVVEGRRTKKGMEFKVVSKDTIVRRDFTMFGPTNLFIPMFDEEKTQLYLVDEARKERERLDFTFSIPADNQLNVRLLGVHLLDKIDQDDWYIEERSAGRDTIQLWIKDSLVYKIDSLVAEASYLRTDSLGKRVLLADTIKFYYKDKPEPKGKRKKEQDSIPAIKFMEISAGVGSTVDLNKNITLEFDRPIVEEGLKNIQLLEMVDSVLTPVDFNLKHDSLKIRRYYVEKEWKPETEYQLLIDSMGIYSIYGLYNNKLVKDFKTKAIEDYGNIIVNVKEATTPIILQLYQGDKEIKVLEERTIKGDGKVIFDYLGEGTYMIRAILDRNGNGKWDTGNYLKHLQPEEIKYLPAEIKLKKK